MTGRHTGMCHSTFIAYSHQCSLSFLYFRESSLVSLPPLSALVSVGVIPSPTQLRRFMKIREFLTDIITVLKQFKTHHEMEKIVSYYEG